MSNDDGCHERPYKTPVELTGLGLRREPGGMGVGDAFSNHC